MLRIFAGNENVSRCKDQRGNDQEDRTAHDSAEQKQNGRQDRQHQGSKQAVAMKAQDPYHAVGGKKQAVYNQIGGKCFCRPPTEECPGDMEDHKSDAPKTPDLFQ